MAKTKSKVNKEKVVKDFVDEVISKEDKPKQQKADASQIIKLVDEIIIQKYSGNSELAIKKITNVLIGAFDGLKL